jgi:hypothetical protein
MAELTLSCPKVISSAGSGAAATGVDIQRRVLIRTGGCFEQNTVLDITAPGDGWAAFGDPVTFSGSTDFTELTQVFRNGVIQLTADSATDNNDVYFVAASGSIGFEYNIQTNDVVQVWKFNPTTTSG